jgi:NAD(P)H dehydrogenase (quinone)
MNILIVLGHPDDKSFNHAIAHTCQNRLIENGHSVIFHDLNKEGFNPVTEKDEIPKDGILETQIKAHCNELSDCDGIIVIHPNWWGQPPAILKGWVDRVFRSGVAYKFAEDDKGDGLPIGLLKAKTALVFNTSNTNEERENIVFKDPLETIWKNCIFNYCGVPQFDRKMFRIIATSNAEQREVWLSEVEAMIDKYFSKTI